MIENSDSSRDKKTIERRRVGQEGPRANEVLSEYDTCRLFVSPDQRVQDEFEKMMRAGSGGLVQITLRVDPEGRMQSTGHFGEVLSSYKSRFGEAKLLIVYAKGDRQSCYLHAYDSSGNEIAIERLINELENTGDPTDPEQQNGAYVLNSMETIVRLGSDY